MDEPKRYPASAMRPDARRHRNRAWCHMTADTLEELHAMARRIGHKRSWFQDGRWPHYDLVESKRRLAVRYGAVEVSGLVRMRQMMKERRDAAAIAACRTLEHGQPGPELNGHDGGVQRDCDVCTAPMTFDKRARVWRCPAGAGHDVVAIEDLGGEAGKG